METKEEIRAESCNGQSQMKPLSQLDDAQCEAAADGQFRYVERFHGGEPSCKSEYADETEGEEDVRQARLSGQEVKAGG